MGGGVNKSESYLVTMSANETCRYQAARHVMSQASLREPQQYFYGDDNEPQKVLRSKIPKFWQGLVRILTPENVDEFAADDKMPGPLRLYVPHGESHGEFESSIQVEKLPLLKNIDANFVYGLNKAPGLLMVATENGHALPYVVPGGRFNELYGWDSYFIALGLLADGLNQYARAIVLHFTYEIENYGKILNANRTYYLTRSQPPFLTDLAKKVYDATGDLAVFVTAMNAAVKEYHSVWNKAPRRHECGLSRYRPEGRGIPPEVEPGHFDWALEIFAAKHNMSIDQFSAAYNAQELVEPDLDDLLMHDRAMRESGHDTSTRLAGSAADLATIDLNALLYKYEVDIAEAAHLIGENRDEWLARAAARRAAVDAHLWSSKDGFYYDYNTKTQELQSVQSVTAFWALWSGLASPEQAAQVVAHLELFEQPGGLSTEARPPLPRSISRQWDYPCGWAPHQILAWKGLENYGYSEDAKRLKAKWAQMVGHTWARVDAVLEKYNVCDVKHAENVSAEYGNQQSEYGFGWTNASLCLAVDPGLSDEAVQRSGVAQLHGHSNS